MDNVKLCLVVFLASLFSINGSSLGTSEQKITHPDNVTTTSTTVSPPITTTVTPTTTSKTTTKATTTTTSTTPSPPPHTSTVPPPTPNPTTSTPTTKPTTHSPSSTTTAAPSKHDRSFDLPSFIGGVILALGLAAIGYVVYKFYKTRTDPNYRSL